MSAKQVFGKPVTGRDRKERARLALVNKKADNKQGQALEYVKKLKQDSASVSQKKIKNSDDVVYTLGVFYNATGEDLVLDKENSKFGYFFCSPPPLVQNGEWGVFLHVQLENMPISEGFVIYRVSNDYYKELLAWKTTNFEFVEHVDIFNVAYDPTADVINNNIETNPQFDVTYNGMHTMTGTDDNIAIYVLTRDDVEAKGK